MATIGIDSSDAQAAPRPPISLHPAFPAIVALWFAALLGIGSLVLPVALLDRLVALTGLAEPPLGFLGRGLIALGAALAGAAAGLAIARRVARAHEPRTSRAAKLAAGARRPISVNEELGGEGLVNGRSLPVTRRRALAIAEDERPSDFLYMAPLPGNEDGDHELAFDAAHATPAPTLPEPLELSEALEEEDEPDEDFAPDFAAPLGAIPDEDQPMSFKQEFQPLAPASRQADDTPAEDAPADEPVPLPFAAPSLARRVLQAEDDAELAESAYEYQGEPEPEPEPATGLWPELEPVASPEPQPAAAEEPRRGDWAEAPVEELGLVQLVQRLGASLSRRREQAAQAAAAPPPPAPTLAAPGDFDAAPAEEAVQAMAAYFGTPAPVAASAPQPAPEPAPEAPEPAPELACEPAETDSVVEPGPAPQPAPFAPLQAAAPRPNLLGAWPGLGEDDEDELDAVPSFTLPLARPVVPTIAFDSSVEDENEDADAGADEDNFSSLLEMRNPFTVKDNAFVRIEEPESEPEVVEPTVVFPGQAGQKALAGAPAASRRPFDAPGEAPARPAGAPADADAALRAALATLQRMSGTA